MYRDYFWTLDQREDCTKVDCYFENTTPFPKWTPVPDIGYVKNVRLEIGYQDS